jgi:hypothetical protein
MGWGELPDAMGGPAGRVGRLSETDSPMLATRLSRPPERLLLALLDGMPRLPERVAASRNAITSLERIDLAT